MKSRTATLVLAGMAAAWTCVAWGDLSMGWANAKEGVAKVATGQALEEEEEAQSGTAVTGEEYMAAARAAAEEAAVDELSRQMVDGLLGTGGGDGEGDGYGESTLPGGGGDIDMQMGGTVVARGAMANGAPGGEAGFSASDLPDTVNDWTVGENWIGQNGGNGFQAWQLQTDGAGVEDSCHVDAVAGFAMIGSTEGESVALRPLAIPLSAGSFSVTMNVASMDSADFLGLAVFDGENEILRWGYGTMDGVGTLMYSTTGGTVYHEAQRDIYPTGPGDFLLTWEQLATGGLLFNLSGTYLPDGASINVPNADRVAAIGIVLMNGWNEDGNEDAGLGARNLQVEGTPAVPEPGVPGLLVAGLAALWGRRAKREK